MEYLVIAGLLRSDFPWLFEIACELYRIETSSASEAAVEVRHRFAALLEETLNAASEIGHNPGVFANSERIYVALLEAVVRDRGRAASRGITFPPNNRFQETGGRPSQHSADDGEAAGS